MNDSGSFVKKIVDKYKPDLSDLYIIHDDLDIPLGSYKIQFGVGPKVHNGVNSVEIELGAKDFWRIRVGVDSRNPNDRTSGEEYVLQDFSEEEKKILDGIIEKICKETNHLLQ
jgi:PTH1 family peptidyl-tRNA hydrolase